MSSKAVTAVLFVQAVLLLFSAGKVRAGAFLPSHLFTATPSKTKQSLLPLYREAQEEQRQQRPKMSSTITFLSQVEPTEIYCRSVSKRIGMTRRTSSSTRMRMSSMSSGDKNDIMTTSSSWQGKLLKVSNYASILCVVDCTVLPLVTVGFPLMGLVANPSTMGWLHELGHSLALFFVLPVGGSATLLNYLYAHRKNWIAALGVLGLFLVFISNAPHSVAEATTGHLHHLMHAVHCGMTHHFANIAGCFCLLGSNFFSQKSGTCALGRKCSHKHHQYRGDKQL